MAREKAAALLAGAGLWLFAAVWLAQGLADPDHFQFDDYYTMERVEGFFRHGDWLTVYVNRQPSYKKPPLHYWAAGVGIAAGAGMPLAIRLPSYAFTLALAMATALLAAALAPTKPWVIPASIALLLANTLTVEMGRSGLLDSGLACFVTLALAAVLLSDRDPRWWLVAGAAAALGSLQKAPVPAIAVAVVLWVGQRAGRPQWRWSELVKVRAFRHALWIAVIGGLGWPLLQLLLHQDLRSFGSFFGGQMARRFVPTPEPGRDPLSWWHWLGASWGAVFWAALAGMALVAWVRALRRDPRLLALVAWVGLGLAAMMFARGLTYDRYLLVFVPVLCAVTSVAFCSSRRFGQLPVLLLLLLAASNLGRVQASHGLILQDGVDTRITAVVEAFDASLRPSETAVLAQGSTNLAAFRFRTRHDVQFAKLKGGYGREELREKNERDGLPLRPPFRGITEIDAFPLVERFFADAVVVEEVPPFLIWTSDRLLPVATAP